ncbi:MAG: capsular polysaccharide biosynthesis protein [Clostridiales bacterium]|nr:capsular polysaccharide biosynthesis protein [Clostridiales bacterium]
MFVDYHSHILPRMDDGAKDAETSLKMIEMLKGQGVGTIVSTSHFYAHRESVTTFIERRKKRFEELMSHKPAIENIILGAEVAIERDLSEKRNFEKLIIEGTNFVLLELPYMPYSPWMKEEIMNIQAEYNVTPIIAHLNRCAEYYTKSQIADILDISDTIIQFNNEIFSSRKQTAFAIQLIKSGCPIVFGSDTHNTEERKPNFDMFEKVMKKKLRRDFDGFVEEYCSYIR